jgi:hypothetical protein
MLTSQTGTGVIDSRWRATAGKRKIVRKYDVDISDKTMFWMGMVPLQGTGAAFD